MVPTRVLKSNKVSLEDIWEDKSVVKPSNPNPQLGREAYTGVRNVGYQKFFENRDPYAEAVRFGKKVDYSRKLTSE